MARTISLRSTKEAALYFEEVLHFDSWESVALKRIAGNRDNSSECLPYDDKPLAVEVVKSLMPHTKMAPHDVVIDLLGFQIGIIQTVRGNFNVLDAENIGRLREVLERINERYGSSFTVDEFISDRARIAAKFGGLMEREFARLGFKLSSVWGIIPEPSETAEADSPTETRFELTLRGLSLVDVGKLTWEEVLEFRRDESSRKALRDLRIFFTENFDGKDQSYVTDKLMQLVDRQNTAAKLWKFDTAQKSLSVAFTNQSTLISSATGLAAAFGGAPLSVVAGAALAFPIGACALEFGKVLIESAQAKVDRPTRFLTRLSALDRNA